MRRSSFQTSTLIIHWLFSALAILIMLIRLIYRKFDEQKYNMGDYLTIGASACAIARLVVIHYVILWGTSNMPDWLRAELVFSAAEIGRRSMGSKLLLINRLLYNSYLWLQKLVLLDLFRRLILDISYGKAIIRGYLVFFFLSYVGSQVSTLIECRPIRLYWQVVPDPGRCVEAHVQLLTLGILNIVTDLMLLVLPVPVVWSLRASWQRKVQLSFLFTLGIFIIAITLVRLPINSMNIDSQLNRTTWVSVELVTAAIVVNAPSIYGLWNKRRRSKLDTAERRERMARSRAGGSRRTTIGGSNEIYAMHPISRSTTRGVVMVTKDLMVTSTYDLERNRARPRTPNASEVETASRGSSQRGMLQYPGTFYRE